MMTFSPSIIFAGNSLDRTSDRSNADALRALYHLESSRVLPFFRLNPAIRDNRLDWHAPAEFPVPPNSDPGAIFLGMQGEHALFTLALDEENDTLNFVDSRSLATVLPHDEAGILAQARTLHDWHARNRFCATCGQRSAAANGGASRACPACGAQHFPKLEPAVIMLVIDKTRDHCLLGRQASWAPGRYSTLAGFVEAGETPETAVRRETLEEAGVHVGAVRYMFSQPWPFPASLMLGFFAEASSTAIVRNDDELENAQWVDRAQASLMVERGEAFSAPGSAPPANSNDTPPHLPGPVSLGHQLVKAWLDGKE